MKYLWNSRRKYRLTLNARSTHDPQLTPNSLNPIASMPIDLARWRAAGLTIDITLPSGAGNPPVSVHLWDGHTGTTAFVAAEHGPDIDTCLDALIPKVTSHLSHRDDPK